MRRIPGFIKRAPRIDLERSAVLIDSKGAEQTVTVVDVSSAGFKLRVSQLPIIGDVVKLRVDGVEESAQIRWAVDDHAGGIFLNQVDLSSIP